MVCGAPELTGSEHWDGQSHGQVPRHSANDAQEQVTVSTVMVVEDEERLGSTGGAAISQTSLEKMGKGYLEIHWI